MSKQIKFKCFLCRKETFTTQSVKKKLSFRVYCEDCSKAMEHKANLFDLKGV